MHFCLFYINSQLNVCTIFWCVDDLYCANATDNDIVIMDSSFTFW